MRKVLLSAIFTVCMYFVHAQTVTINPTPLSTTQLNGLGSSNYHVSEYIYTDAEIGNTNFTTAGTALNQINLNMTATSDKPAQVFSNVKIYLKEVSAATTGFSAGTYSTAGYTEVYSGTFPATTVGWMGVQLTTPFIRTAGSNLQMMIERTDNVLPYTATAPPTWQSTTGATSGSRRYNGNTALSGSTVLAVSAHRVVVQFRHAVANDASVGVITGAGKLPLGYGGSQNLTVTVTNTGTAALTNLPVTLDVTGANSYNTSQNIASLAAGASTVVTFTTFAPTAAGNNVVTISVPSDGDASNNSSSMNLVTTTNTFALSNDDAFTPGSSIGFNTGSGNLLVQMPVYKDNNLESVRVSITTEASASGNTVYGVLVSSTGTILAQSPNYTIQGSDLGNYITLTFAAPQAVTAGTTYYIGLAQTANTTGYFPVNTQSTKPNVAHSTPLAGGTVSNYTNFGSLMIEGVFSNVFPVQLTAFTGIRQGNANRLEWSTSTESNNKAFELERSADGRNFTAIATVASKAEGGNSNTELHYNFVDESPFKSTNYYRLKQVDKDGKFSYSAVVVIKGEKTRFSITAAYPNPVRERLNIAVTSSVNEKATLTITDLSGRIVKQINLSLIAGDNYIPVDVTSLNSGAYMVRMVNSINEMQTIKFIRQ